MNEIPMQDDDRSHAADLPEAQLEELRREYGKRKRRGQWTALAAVSLFVLAISLFFGVYNAGQQIKEAHPHVRPGRTNKITAYVAVAIASVPWYFGCRLAFNSRRCFSKDARLALSEDERQQVLYLRSFDDDETQNPDFGHKWGRYRGMPIPKFERVRTEQSIVKELARCVGPVVAIGRPNEPLPELGAFRFYVADDDWKAEIVKQMKSCRLVVVRVGDTEGLLWEVRQLLDGVSPDQIVVHSPQLSIPEPINGVLMKKSGTELGSAKFFTFDNAWRPHQFETIAGVLKFQNLYLEKRKLVQWIEAIQDSAVRAGYRLIAVLLSRLGIYCLAAVMFNFAAAVASFLIVWAFEPRNTSWVFGCSYVGCLATLTIIAYFCPLGEWPPAEDEERNG